MYRRMSTVCGRNPVGRICSAPCILNQHCRVGARPPVSAEAATSMFPSSGRCLHSQRDRLLDLGSPYILRIVSPRPLLHPVPPTHPHYAGQARGHAGPCGGRPGGDHRVPRADGAGDDREGAAAERGGPRAQAAPHPAAGETWCSFCFPLLSQRASHKPLHSACVKMPLKQQECLAGRTRSAGCEHSKQLVFGPASNRFTTVLLRYGYLSLSRLGHPGRWTTRGSRPLTSSGSARSSWARSPTRRSCCCSPRPRRAPPGPSQVSVLSVL